MASPVKNFQDPSGVSRMLDGMRLSSAAHVGPDLRALFFGVVPFDPSLMIFGLANHRFIDTSVKLVKLPPPPMGRMFVATFPPVYRERGGGSNRPQQGQVWPRFVEGS